MRKIDADILIAILEARANMAAGLPAEGVFLSVERIVEAMPTVDDIPHGFWNSGGYACGETEYKCSVCNGTEWRTSIDRFKYCPFCGAKMDGDPHDGT